MIRNKKFPVTLFMGKRLKSLLPLTALLILPQFCSATDGPFFSNQTFTSTYNWHQLLKTYSPKKQLGSCLIQIILRDHHSEGQRSKLWMGDIFITHSETGKTEYLPLLKSTSNRYLWSVFKTKNLIKLIYHLTDTDPETLTKVDDKLTIILTNAPQFPQSSHWEYNSKTYVKDKNDYILSENSKIICTENN